MTWRTLISALLFAVVASGARAHDYKVGPIAIDHPWTRATPKNAPVAGGYLKITNTGTTPDRLTGGSTEVAKRFEALTPSGWRAAHASTSGSSAWSHRGSSC